MSNNEYRLGNYMQGPLGEIMRVDILGHLNYPDYIHASNDKAFGQNEFYPIELSPEILEKAGFTTDEGKVEYVIGLPIGFGSDLYIENEDHESMGCGIKDSKGFHYFKDVKYLHQLQNLYFALTGEELRLTL